MSFRQIWQLVKETLSEWGDDKVPRLSASLAYYTIFSIAPIIVIGVEIAGLVFGKEAAQGEDLKFLIPRFARRQFLL